MMQPLLPTSIGLSGSGIVLAAESQDFSVPSLTALIVAISGLITAYAALRKDRGEREELTRRERAELRRLRREAKRGDGED